MDAITGASATAGSSTSSARTSLAANYEMFLTLLTEQLQNQDPLNPLDSNEFVNQLVQFTSVEQQIAQNDNLERLISIQTTASASSAVALIGKQALIGDGRADLVGERATWRYAMTEPARSVDLSITDAEGRVVRNLQGETGVGSHELVWDGLTDAGEPAPPGVYRLTATAVGDEDRTVDVAVGGWSNVTGADFSGADAALLFGDRAVAVADVLSVRERPAAP